MNEDRKNVKKIVQVVFSNKIHENKCMYVHKRDSVMYKPSQFVKYV